MVNSTKYAVGGPFTWYDDADPKNESKKSCLDLVMISKALVKHIDQLFIDKNLNWTPARPISKTKMRYTNHYALIFKLKNLPRKPKIAPGIKPKIWNTRKEGGWEAYTKATQCNDRFKAVAVAPSEDVTVAMKTIEKELEKVKFKSFGKVKLGKSAKVSQEVKTLNKEKACIVKNGNAEELSEVNKKLTVNYLQEQREDLEKGFKSLKETWKTKGRSASIFKLKEINLACEQ